MRTSLRWSNCVVFNSPGFNLELAKRGVDGEWLAAKTGLNRATISDARSGKPIHVKTARLISEALAAQPVLEIAERLLSLAGSPEGTLDYKAYKTLPAPPAPPTPD